MFDVIKNSTKDLKSLKSKYNLSYFNSIISNRGWQSLFFYRISHFLFLNNVPLLPLIFTRIVQILYGIDIDFKAKLHGGIIIIHGNGLVIGAGTIIHENTIIYHQVTLGIKNTPTNDGFPLIEKNVILGAGCKILGKVIIGKNSIIGANTVITQDVPENSIVKLNIHSLTIKPINEKSSNPR